MGKRKYFIVVDSDDRRRARVSFELNKRGAHVEPCATIDEFSRNVPEHSKVLVWDEGFSLDNTMSYFRAKGQWAPLIAYSNNFDPNRISDVVRSGVSDYFSWPIDFDGFFERILGSDEHSSAFERIRKKSVEAEFLLRNLSKRESEVLRSLSEGGSNKHIANELLISPRTVEIHRANMMKKIGARSTAEAVRIAVEAGQSIDVSVAA
jgi:FixJ family two-component response regulator